MITNEWVIKKMGVFLHNEVFKEIEQGFQILNTILCRSHFIQSRFYIEQSNFIFTF